MTADSEEAKHDTGVSPAMALQHAQLCLQDVPESITTTARALKTYSKLEKALIAYASASPRQTADEQTLEKKAKMVLLDAGMARSMAMEMITRWKRRPVVDDVKVAKKESAKTEAASKSTASATTDKPAKNISSHKMTSEKARPGTDVAAAASEITAQVSPLEEALAALAIRATSQESRFYTESIVTASKEIDLKDVNLFVGERQLLNDAHIRIKEGVKYGLVGRNGTGKSTLLRALGDGLIPGLPNNVKILLVSQLGIEEALRVLASSASKELSVLDAVLQGDKQRVRAETDVAALQAAIDSGKRSEVESIVKSIRLDESLAALEEARRISTKRSGTRGKHARTALIAAESAYEHAKAGFPDNDDATTAQDWEQQAADLHAKALAVLEETDAATVVPRAHAILRGLGFSDTMIGRPYAQLSGGWKSRCSLASALLLSNHILLLDEPVNFLDLPSILWLEWFVQQGRETVVTVAHDVEFLNAVSDELIVLKNNKLEYFDGNLADYTRTKRRQYKHAVKQQDALDRKKDMVEKSIQEGLKQARKTGDDNRMRMVKSRQKKLEERWGLERNAAGHRFKLNRDFGGYHLTSRGGVDVEDVASAVHYVFPDPDPLPFAASLVHIDHVSFQHTTAKEPLLKDVNITIDIGDRIGLVGPNGHGKTTLLQLMIGERLPTSGTIQKHTRLRTAYYAQQAMADVSFQQSKQTALQHFIEHCAAEELTHESKARGFLAQFDLKGRTVDAMPIGKLSGGQRVKLLLAEVVCCGPHLLILDEVTTHMDSESIRALIGALKAFRGAVVLISHDRHAIKEVIEGRKADDDGAADSDSDDVNDDASDDAAGIDGAHASLNPSGTAAQRRTFLVQNGRVRPLPTDAEIGHGGGLAGVEQYVQSVEKSMQASIGDGGVVV